MTVNNPVIWLKRSNDAFIFVFPSLYEILCFFFYEAAHEFHSLSDLLFPFKHNLFITEEPCSMTWLKVNENEITEVIFMPDYFLSLVTKVTV